MVFLSALVPAILSMAYTGLAVSRPVIENRSETYVATSAIDAAVAQGRSAADIGAPGGPCPDQASSPGGAQMQTLSLDGLEATIFCNGYPYPEGCPPSLDRFVTYTAEVRKPGDSTVLAESSAEVTYRFKADSGTYQSDIRQFTPDAAGPVTTTTLPACAA